MKLRLSAKFIFTFLALTFVMNEAHEIVHTSVGRIICGAWGERDFNVWGTCESCQTNPWEILSTAVGPIFTFLMVWYGASFLKPMNTNRQKSFGFAMIFANMPFGRLFNPLLGGGDEVVVLNHFIHNHDMARVIIAALIILITFIPLKKAYQTIENKYKIGWFSLFYIVPMLLDFALVLGLMNTLLEKGVLSNYWILGSPILVTVWTVGVLMAFFLTKKNIYTLGDARV